MFKYKGLMEYFNRISAIPRGSFNEQGIADYLCGFAEARGLYCYRDEHNNVFISKPATPDRAGEDALLLQGHTDMFCEKNEGVDHDFECDGLELYEEEGWLRARGSTLGADNGVAVAVMLYLLDGAEGALCSYPTLECLFTSAEEVGLVGAKSFDYSLVTARRMINMDSADESLIIAGCAGGSRKSLVLDAQWQKTRGEAVKIGVKGLFGGHSGEDIALGRANANKLLGRVLLSLGKLNISYICGGSKDNAIPREASALLLVPSAEEAIRAVAALEVEIGEELCACDSGFALTAERCDAPERMLGDEQSRKTVFLLSTVANGVLEHNRSIPELVEYSRNLGVVRTSDSQLEFVFSARSALPSRLSASAAELAAYGELLGMRLCDGESYPGWSYAESSEIREAYARAYRAVCGDDIKVTLIHAGLECGIIKERLPHMDMISCGPLVLNLHSPDEALRLDSFERFFEIILYLISNK